MDTSHPPWKFSLGIIKGHSNPSLLPSSHRLLQSLAGIREAWASWTKSSGSQGSWMRLWVSGFEKSGSRFIFQLLALRKSLKISKPKFFSQESNVSGSNCMSEKSCFQTLMTLILVLGESWLLKAFKADGNLETFMVAFAQARQIMGHDVLAGVKQHASEGEKWRIRDNDENNKPTKKLQNAIFKDKFFSNFFKETFFVALLSIRWWWFHPKTQTCPVKMWAVNSSNQVRTAPWRKHLQLASCGLFWKNTPTFKLCFHPIFWRWRTAEPSRLGGISPKIPPVFCTKKVEVREGSTSLGTMTPQKRTGAHHNKVNQGESPRSQQQDLPRSTSPPPDPQNDLPILLSTHHHPATQGTIQSSQHGIFHLGFRKRCSAWNLI